jgi:peptide/nickel transport system permease protein
VSALLFAHLLTGTVVAEVVFAWPGLGRVMVESVWSVDFPVLTGAMLLFVVLFMFFNLMADILYVVVDPRIRLE